MIKKLMLVISLICVMSSSFASMSMMAVEGSYKLEEGESWECYDVFEIYASSTDHIFYSIAGDDDLIVSLDEDEINAGLIKYKDSQRVGFFSASFDEQTNIFIYAGKGLDGVWPYSFEFSVRKVGYYGIHLVVKSFHQEKLFWFKMSCRYLLLD